MKRKIGAILLAVSAMLGIPVITAPAASARCCDIHDPGCGAHEHGSIPGADPAADDKPDRAADCVQSAVRYKGRSVWPFAEGCRSGKAKDRARFRTSLEAIGH